MYEDMATVKPLLLSGGAKGADHEWTKYAINHNHDIVNWSFSGHSAATESTKLSNDHLSNANKFVERANKHILRRFPSNNEHVNNLLRRNYYQICDTERVYAISTFIDDKSLLKVGGGTAWALQMYLDRFLFDNEDINLCELYLFEQSKELWFSWKIDQWIQIDQPPNPYGVYTGIGTRDINQAGINAIQKLI